MPNPANLAFIQAETSAGVPYALATLDVYAVGTTTPLNLYQNEAGSTPQVNPVVADSVGIFPEFFLNEKRFKAILKSAGGSPLKTWQVVNGGMADWVLDNSGILVTGGTSTAFTVTPYQKLSTPADGDSLRIRFHATNTTGSPTLNAGGGAKSIRMGDGTGTDIDAIYLIGGQVYDLVYYSSLNGASGGWLVAGQVFIRPQAFNGIQFPATQNASTDVNILDDYEEGTFTPVINGTSAAGAGTYSTQGGSYVKVGKIVHFTVELVWSAHTGTGNMLVGGLPFTSLSNRETPVAVQVDVLTLANPFYAYVDAAATTVILGTAAAAAGAFTALLMDTAATLRVAGCYIASA